MNHFLQALPKDRQKVNMNDKMALSECVDKVSYGMQYGERDQRG